MVAYAEAAPAEATRPAFTFTDGLDRQYHDIDANAHGNHLELSGEDVYSTDFAEATTEAQAIRLVEQHYSEPFTEAMLQAPRDNWGPNVTFEQAVAAGHGNGDIRAIPKGDYVCIEECEPTVDGFVRIGLVG